MKIKRDIGWLVEYEDGTIEKLGAWDIKDLFFEGYRESRFNPFDTKIKNIEKIIGFKCRLVGTTSPVFKTKGECVVWANETLNSANLDVKNFNKLEEEDIPVED